MDSINKLKLSLYAAKKKNGKWQQKMAKMPGKIRIIGKTPVVDMHCMPSDLQLVSSSKLHNYVGSCKSRIMRIIKEEGIITSEDGMWRLREDLQDKGLAVYVTGRMGCYYLFHLSWTPEGVVFIKDIINSRAKH